jgi:uncharacterized repeat protein (TIGR03837 family)
MSLNPILPSSLAIFCKVVDNFGDIGICWRLARQLRQEFGIAVTLWVDHLPSFRRICPEVSINAAIQQVAGVTVRHWQSQEGSFTPDEIADIVIEFFGCDIPPGYITAMAQCNPRPVWLNLEGLTAEEWVEGCHTLPSMHPRLPLTKHFFFPGFTAKTGGLLHEAGMEEARGRFQSDPAAMADFLARLGVTPPEQRSLKVSLFCYPHAPVAALFDAWQGAGSPVTCLVPEGVASEAVRLFLDQEPKAGAVRSRGALTVRVIPFVAQPDYDRLLWACDLNFVRGEDSFVRAQWAGKPFVWHIYPQDKDLHHVKLRAFLKRYVEGVEAETVSLAEVSLAWNGASNVEAGGQDGQAVWQELWPALLGDLPNISRQAAAWRQKILENGDLASNLLNFAAALRSVPAENKV